MTTALIIARLDRELATKGFAREKATWNRQHGTLVEVIDVQSSKAGDTVTINVGVLERGVYLACWGREAGLFVEEPFCTVRARIGQLLDNKDRWWDIGSPSAADEMADCLIEHALPFLARMQSLEEMRDWLASAGAPSPKTPLSSICFAVLLSKLGDVDRACATLVELESKALGAWKARAKEVSVRIGCDRPPASDHQQAPI